MINDTIMDLYKSGVLTGRHKTIWPGRITGSFALGSQELYDFIDHNPIVLLHPSSVVNDPYRFGRNFKMVSINTAVEVDITGQVCSESIGHRLLSGVGGAADTHIGAQRSQGGRGIIAIRSTTSDESTSKITFQLQPGAKVSISRNDVDTVITEYGIAELKGRPIGQRVSRLIDIAHPKFRESLLQQAQEVKYL
jgi:acyl-CoA hydrolase